MAVFLDIWDYINLVVEAIPKYGVTQSQHHEVIQTLAKLPRLVDNERNSEIQQNSPLEKALQSFIQATQSVIQSTRLDVEYVEATVKCFETHVNQVVGWMREMVRQMKGEDLYVEVDDNNEKELTVEEPIAETLMWPKTEEVPVTLLDGDELPDLLDEDVIELEFLANLEEDSTELLEEPTLTITETLSDAKQNKISTPSISMVVHFHYIIASDTFFSNNFIQGLSYEAQEVNSTRENWMTIIPSIPSTLRSVDADGEDEMVRIMEWFKLEFDFG